MVDNFHIYAIMTSIVVCTFFVAYIIGISVVSNDGTVTFTDHLVSCENSRCDYTAIGAIIFGTLVAIGVAGTVWVFAGKLADSCSPNSFFSFLSSLIR